MANSTKSVCLDGLDESTIKAAEQNEEYQSGNRGRGVNGDTILEAIPEHDQTPCEKVYNHHNSWIVLGRDRNGGKSSGYGGKGHTQAHSIDIVVGKGGHCGDFDDGQLLPPNFVADTARIYISQKTDIDEYFGINAGQMGQSVAKSGIGIKADAVRIVGTEGIKLVTRTESQNSKNGFAPYNGIEIIAGNDDSSLQSMVKGDDLLECLKELEQRINDISDYLTQFADAQIEFNAKVKDHTHPLNGSAIDPLSGLIPIDPTSTAKSSLNLRTPAAIANSKINNMSLDLYNAHRPNLNVFWRNKYLSSAGDNYILSRYNKVN